MILTKYSINYFGIRRKKINQKRGDRKPSLKRRLWQFIYQPDTVYSPGNNLNKGIGLFLGNYLDSLVEVGRPTHHERHHSLHLIKVLDSIRGES